MSRARTLVAAIVAAAAFCLAARGEDSYLYWMVSTEDGAWGDFAAAALRAMETADGDKSKSTVIDVKAPEDYNEETKLGTYVNTYSVFGSGLYEGWTFFVEFLRYNEAGEYTHSEYLPGHSYDELVRSRALVMDYMIPTGIMDGAAFNFAVAPEPSSGLMLLLGLAAVGLKRRRGA